MGDKDRDIANDLDTFLMRIVVQALPLAEKDELAVYLALNGYIEFLRGQQPVLPGRAGARALPR